MSIFDIFKELDAKKKTAEPPGAPEYIIAGLGNPGREYLCTRHNTGFMAVETIAAGAGVALERLRFKSLTAVASIGGHSVLLMKPSTFMNLSGEALREAMQFYKIPPERAIIIFDDTTLAVGKMRVRRHGSDGGHNGIKNIIYLSGSDAFPRIKIGIGARPEGWELADWVLSKFTEDELAALAPMFKNAGEAARLIMDGKTDEAMNRFN